MTRSGVNPKDFVLSFTENINGASMSYSMPFSSVDQYVDGLLRKVTVYGVAIGSCLVLSIGLWRVMERKKTVIFILNQLTLLTMVIRSSLLLSYSLGNLSQVSYVFTGILYPHSFQPFTVSIAANAFQVILVALIETSMCFQLFMIFRSPEVRYWCYSLTAVFTVLGLFVVSLYLYGVSRMSVGYRDLFFTGINHQKTASWVESLPVIMFSISINLMCIALVAKLIHSIKCRRYLGLRQFDSFHILAIMFGQTLFIPSILVWVNFGLSSEEGTLLSTISILMIVLTLPLSSMWASSANSTKSQVCNNFIRKTSSDGYNTATSEGFEFAYKLSKIDKLNSANTDLEKETLRESPVSLSNQKVSFGTDPLGPTQSIPENTFLKIAKGLPQVVNEESRNSFETITNSPRE